MQVLLRSCGDVGAGETNVMRVESVWDYPRPPRLEPCADRVRIEFGDRVIVDTANPPKARLTGYVVDTIVK